MKIAIVIGHDERSQGAFSTYLGKSEYDYNSQVAQELDKIADIDVYRRMPGKGYKSSMRELSSRVNRKDYDLVAELHFNAATGKAHGCEALYYGSNYATRAIAGTFCDTITAYYSTRNRGAKGLTSESDRGYWFLRYIKAPALILEPFFGDNEEARKFEDPAKYAGILHKWLIQVTP